MKLNFSTLWSISKMEHPNYSIMFQINPMLWIKYSSYNVQVSLNQVAKAVLKTTHQLTDLKFVETLMEHTWTLGMLDCHKLGSKIKEKS